jgi:ubiquinone/menaquinone biosynthesis C-methylase UbiE
VILDAGCGSGFLIHKLGSMETRFIGLDLGRVEIKSAASKCPLADFVIGDATQLPFREKTFDWVICTEVLEHLKNPYSAVKEFRRVLKEGGKL